MTCSSAPGGSPDGEPPTAWRLWAFQEPSEPTWAAMTSRSRSSASRRLARALSCFLLRKLSV